MVHDKLFEGEYRLLKVSFDKDSSTWQLMFENSVLVQIRCFWRLLKHGRIKWTVNDHGHQYGLNKPINLTEVIESELNERNLIEIQRNTLTGDLFLKFDENFVLEIYTDSKGYETWILNYDGKQIVGMGGGDISFF